MKRTSVYSLAALAATSTVLWALLTDQLFWSPVGLLHEQDLFSHETIERFEALGPRTQYLNLNIPIHGDLGDPSTEELIRLSVIDFCQLPRNLTVFHSLSRRLEDGTRQSGREYFELSDPSLVGDQCSTDAIISLLQSYEAYDFGGHMRSGRTIIVLPESWRFSRNGWESFAEVYFTRRGELDSIRLRQRREGKSSVFDGLSLFLTAEYDGQTNTAFRTIGHYSFAARLGYIY